jgi:hypothetical protein
LIIHDFGGFGMSEGLPFDAEAIAAALAHAARAQGNATSVTAFDLLPENWAKEYVRVLS